ncbi:MAG: bifunctional oligoribonuclease/PAP phosphatase NrnA [Ruminococcaceae bacterium]|nr:bifunctional oligoribonuclease/PAP phosphatase NrnA [Oscillospiraceae bacterium]
MNRQVMRNILEKIRSYHRVIIFRHLRPDGDAVGASKGLREILRSSFPEKEIYLLNSDYSDYVAFLGGEDEEIDEKLYEDALGIVVDTATSQRISNPKFGLCKELIKIDHHIPTDAYGALELVEEERSSCCELIASFYQACSDELVMTKEAATYLYTGMVTDSGRFRFRSVSGDTLRLAGMLLDQGVDTEQLYANLYMKEFDTLKFQSYVYQTMEISENGVAYVYVDQKTRLRFGLSFEEACACVGYMDSIKGSLIWLAFIEGTDGVIRVRLRSRFVTINELAESYGGGGHACASGCNVNDRKQMRELIGKADALLKDYKENNEGWL